MRKLTDEEKRALKILYQDKELQFKGLIRQFIIGNTYEPKYKIGDFVMITDPSTRIYGNRADKIKCKITALNWYLREKGDEFISYEAVALDQDGNDYFMVAEESINGKPQERFIVGRCDNNINQIEKKSKHSQETFL